ncbi:MAG: GNAT family N-acetyltransferase [Deinococcota bacterium]
MIRRLTEQDVAAYLELRRRAVWAVPDELTNPSKADAKARRLAATWGYFEDDNLASTATFRPLTMWLAGQVVPMAGLASVGTGPEYRRKGYVKKLLEHGLTNLHAHNQTEAVKNDPSSGIGWCLEYPFDAQYYARYGWQSLPNGLRIQVPPEQLKPVQNVQPQATSINLKHVASKRDVFPQLAEIHKGFAQGYNFALCRQDDDYINWDIVTDADDIDFGYLFAEGAYVFAYGERKNGTQTLYVEDCGYRDQAGRLALFTFLANLQGDVDVIDIHLTPDDPLLFDLHKFIKGKQVFFQARVVDVPVMFQNLPTAERLGHVTVKIHDKLCPWNEGVFNLVMNTEGNAATRTSKQADVSVDVRALPLLLTGISTPEQLTHYGLAEGDVAQLAPLAGVAGGVSFMARADYF